MKTNSNRKQHKATHMELFPIACNQETNTFEEWIARNQNLTNMEHTLQYEAI